VTLLSSKEPYAIYKEPYRKTDRQTHRGYKGLQVPLFNLTVNVGHDKWLQVPPFNIMVNVGNDNYTS